MKLKFLNDQAKFLSTKLVKSDYHPIEVGPK